MRDVSCTAIKVVNKNWYTSHLSYGSLSSSIVTIIGKLLHNNQPLHIKFKNLRFFATWLCISKIYFDKLV